MKHHCKVCNSLIHPRRAAMGYTTTCIEHSAAQKYTGNVVADSKATTWIQVVKDPETAKHLSQLSQTRGRI